MGATTGLSAARVVRSRPESMSWPNMIKLMDTIKPPPLAEAAWNQAGQSEDGSLATSASTLNLDPTGGVWVGGTITWDFASGPDSGASPFSGAIGAQYQSVIEQAIQAWAGASGLNFEQVSDPAAADLQIGWGTFDTAESDVIGYTSADQADGVFTPGTTVRLEDPSETPLVETSGGQLTYSDTGATLYQAALHEIGHTLGLSDDSDPDSVMYYQLDSSNQGLDSTDIASIQALYGYSAGVEPVTARHRQRESVGSGDVFVCARPSGTKQPTCRGQFGRAAPCGFALIRKPDAKGLRQPPQNLREAVADVAPVVKSLPLN